MRDLLINKSCPFWQNYDSNLSGKSAYFFTTLFKFVQHNVIQIYNGVNIGGYKQLLNNNIGK